MRPHLGEIERIPTRLLRPRCGLRLGHDLRLHRPSRELAFLDSAVQIFLCALASLADDLRGFAVGPVAMTLLGLEMKLHPYALAGGVDQAVCMRAVAVDMSHVSRQAAIRE